MVLSIWLRLFLSFSSALIWGLILRKIGVPGGIMLGGMVGAALFNIISEQGYAPYFARFFAQSIAGGFLGASVDRSKLRQLPRLALPLAIIMLFMWITDLFIGFVISLVSPLDILTALCSGIPGGINDVPLIAADMGADAGTVAVLQFVRLITGIALVPLLIRIIDSEAVNSSESRRIKADRKICQEPWKHQLLALVVALAGGYVGRLTRISGGILLFSMLAVALLHVTTDCGKMDPNLKVIAQLCSGTYIGCMFTKQDVLDLRYLVVPSLVLMVLFLLNSYLSAILLKKICHFSRREGMLAASPAGASEIVLISSDLNVSGEMSADIMILHIFRVIIAVAITPQLILLITKLCQ